MLRLNRATSGYRLIKVATTLHVLSSGISDYGLFGACRCDFHHNPSAFSCCSRAVTCRADGGLGAGGAGGCSGTRSGSRRPALLSVELQKQPHNPSFSAPLRPAQITHYSRLNRARVWGNQAAWEAEERTEAIPAAYIWYAGCTCPFAELCLHLCVCATLCFCMHVLF